MQISDFHYELPENLIAQEPREDRSRSRMLFVDRAANAFSDDHFSNFPGYLRKGDVLVLNNTKVFPARLLGRSETGAAAEVFLIRETAELQWETLARPARRLRPGKRLIFGERLSGEVVEKTDDGRVVVRFKPAGDFDEILDEIGRTPLPPYIKRDQSVHNDRDRYQTVFAKNRGAIASPTAGLHFTGDVMDEIRDRGVTIAEITLHVGYGTFEPVRVEDVSEHRVMSEQFEIPEATAGVLNRARAEGRRIIAVGTTTTRALETALSKDPNFAAGKNVADLTITPGFRFRAIDGLLTNFHLPKSSLLILVSTFGGHELIMKAYGHAVAAGYRFYSYGDCMLIV